LQYQIATEYYVTCVININIWPAGGLTWFSAFSIKAGQAVRAYVWISWIRLGNNLAA
jgi:hypothetical protein